MHVLVCTGENGMKLKFRKSGGFAAMFMGCEFDTETSPAPELEALVKSSNIVNERSKRVEAARDVFYYTFEVDLNGQKNKVTFDQLSVPETVKPLLEYCLSQSKNMLPD